MAVFLSFYPKMKMNIRKAKMQKLATDFTFLKKKLQIFRKSLQDEGGTV